MNNKILYCFIYALVLTSCSKKSMPQDSIYMRYDGYINFNVKVADKSFGNFIFDTGWSGVCLDSIFCKKNQLVFNSTDIKANGVGNSTILAKLVTDTIHFVISNKEKRFAPSSILLNLKEMVGKNIDGIFGIETFSHKPYKIDYLSQHITYIDTVKGYEEIKVTFQNRNIFLPLSLTLKNGNKIEGRFLLDTGSSRTILNSQLYSLDGVHNSINKKKYFSKGGIGGVSNGYFLTVSKASIGNFILEDLFISVSNDSLGALANPDYMGIIGNDILDDFHIILDHQKEKIWIKPNKNFNKNFRKLFKSVSIQDTGEKLIVAGIVEDSDAFRKGIRMNDQILEINNIPVEQIDLDKFVKKLKAKDILKLKLKRDGEEKEIKFELNIFLKA